MADDKVQFEYGNVLPEFRGTGNDVAARIEGLARYSERRLPHLKKFAADLKAWQEGTGTMDAERFYSGLTLLEIAMTETEVIYSSIQLHGFTNNHEETERFAGAVEATLMPHVKAGHDAVDIIRTVDPHEIERFAEEIPNIARDTEKMKEYYPKSRYQVTFGRGPRDYKQQLISLYEKYGEEALSSAYFSENPGSLKERLIGRQFAANFTGQLRQAEKVMKLHHTSTYEEYLLKKTGIPLAVTRAFYSDPLSLNYTLPHFDDMEEEIASNNNEAPAKQKANMAAVRGNVDNAIKAYKEFSPELGARIEKMVDSGNVHIVQPEDDVANPAIGILINDTIPYDMYIGNQLMICLNAIYEQQGGRAFAHEASHGLEYEARKASGKMNQDLFLSELIAHVGEYIVLEHHMRNEPDISELFDVVFQSAYKEDSLMFQIAASSKAQQKLLYELPRFPRNLKVEKIAQAHDEAAQNILGFIHPDFVDDMGFNSTPLDPQMYGYNMIDIQSYSFAILGARAFAHKLFTATPEEREQMGKDWAYVIENAHEFNWGSALTHVGVDIHAPDFVERATHFSHELLDITADIASQRDPKNAYRIGGDGIKSRGRYVEGIERERLQKAAQPKQAGGRA